MTSDHKEAEPKAFSYVRFSTPAQQHGDSYARQTRKAAQYAAERGLTLDTELQLTDLGVSGYRGKNAKKGALGAFLRAVEDKTVAKGSFLLIENLDRLSRDEIHESLPLFLNIINAGIVLVTLTNGEAFSRERLRKEPWSIRHRTHPLPSGELLQGTKSSGGEGEQQDAPRTRSDAGSAPLHQTNAWVDQMV